MRMLLFALLFGALAVPPLAAADKVEIKGDKVAFDVYDGHVEKKDSGAKGDASYLIFFDFPSFKKVFAIAEGEKKTSIPADTFNTKQVIALIKRSDKPWTYKVEKVTADGDKLYIEYKAEAGEGKEAKYASPLILTVKKKVYKTIAFIENGKEVGGIKALDK